MKMPTVSVVVPVYNTSEYLEACVASILAQTFTDFELLLIDDGSTDGSLELCGRLAQTDDRIRVLHHENRGPSYTRNCGIDEARGEFISFVDSDDWVEPDMLEKTVAAAKETDADMVISGILYDTEYNGKLKSHRTVKPQNAVLDTSEKIVSRFVEWKRPHLLDGVWSKLYRVSTLKESGILMPEGEIYEDTAFNVRFIKYIHTVTTVDQSFYHYMQWNRGNITRSYHPEKPKLLAARIRDMLDYLEPFGGKAAVPIRYVHYLYIQYAFSGIIDSYLPAAAFTRKKRRAMIRQTVGRPEYGDALMNGKPLGGAGLSEKLTYMAAGTKNAFIISRFSWMLYILKYKLPHLFMKLRR